ncbi:MAG: ABC transporter ATP-binding protein [Bacteroidota bacterium]
MDNQEIKSGQIVDLGILKRIFRFVKPYIKTFYFLAFLTLSLGILAPLRPFLTQIAIDDYVAVNDFNGLFRMTLILFGLLFVQAAVQYLHTYFSGWLGQSVIKDIRVKLFEHLMDLRLKFYDKTAIGRLVTRNVSDVETLANVFSEGLAAMLGDLLQLVFILGFMFYIDWELTLVSLSTLPILILATYIFKEKIKVAFNEVRSAVANLNSFVQEHITGMNIVQIFNSEKTEFDKFEAINEEHKKANIRSVLYYSVYFPVAEVISATGIGLLIWYGGKNTLDGNISPGVLIAFIMYIQMFFRPIRMIADRFNTLQLGIVSSARILKLLDSKENMTNEGDIKPKALEGRVKFENVWFAYNNDDYVLKDISFEAKEGETIAFVGATGAGKSSIINLMNRFYEHQKGNILIDDVRVEDYELKGLRQNIGYVLQDVFLFSDTIYNNITLGASIDKSKVVRAAELVGALKFIEKLPGGFEYNVMERGSTLSVGQRQLISFVRAVVYDPKIIILDEATSSVDTETEEMIQDAIERLMKGRTSIVIAHRLSTIQKADNIIVLDKGEIKEKGQHSDLLSKDGYYAQLHKMQYKDALEVKV